MWRLLLVAGTSLGIGAAQSVAPFTLILREGQVGSFTSNKLIAVRPDGARAEATVPGDGVYTGWEPRTVELPGERRRLVIAERVRMVSTYYMSRREAEAKTKRAGSEGCRSELAVGARLLGEEKIHGVVVLRYDEGGGQERWLAPTLGCVSLHEIVRSERGVFERIAVSLDLGEPDAKWFAVPEGLKEVPPSAQMSEVNVQSGGRTPKVRLDHRYDRDYWGSGRFKPEP